VITPKGDISPIWRANPLLPNLKFEKHKDTVTLVMTAQTMSLFACL